LQTNESRFNYCEDSFTSWFYKMKFDEKQRIGGSSIIFNPPPGGFGAQFYAAENGQIIGRVQVDDSKQGPPGHVHGGALATLIDEAMGASAWFSGYRVVAVHLEFDLKLAVPLNIEITMRGWVVRREGRKVFTAGELLLPDGRIAVTGSGIFVEAPQLVGAGGMNPFAYLDQSGQLNSGDGDDQATSGS
jgi:acyl-coenzyme A thioesterase PaaI-like protein